MSRKARKLAAERRRSAANPAHLRDIRRRAARLAPEDFDEYAQQWSFSAHYVEPSQSPTLRAVADRLALAPPADTASVCSAIIAQGYKPIRTSDAIRALADALAGPGALINRRSAEAIADLAYSYTHNGLTDEDGALLITAPPSAIAELCAEIYELTAADADAINSIDYLAALLAEADRIE